MPIAGITGQGLAAIAMSVTLLWACFISERLTVKQASAQQASVIRELQRMQRNRGSEPASYPAPRVKPNPRGTIG